MQPFVCGLVLVLACSSASDAPPTPDTPPSPSLDPGELPLLPPGNHAGMIVGFNASHSIATAAAIDARWREAVSAGMAIGRVQLDWADLEPSPGRYDMSKLDDKLAALSRDHVRPFVLLDSVDGEIPSDLRTRLDANQIGWDHADVIARHAELLRRAMPVLQAHGVWVLAVANEIGNTLDDLPPAVRSTRTDQLVALLTAARDEVHRIDPRMAVVVTVREQQFEAGDTEAPFVALSDVASFNLYCGRFANDLRITSDPVGVGVILDGMLARAGAKQVVIQELGCHAGYEGRPSPTQATADQQARFFEVVLGELAIRPRLRAAIVFQLVDWDPALVESAYSAPFRAAGLPPAFIAQFAESLNTVGLIRFSDGAARPAWSVFLRAL